MPTRDVSADRARASTQSDADRFFTCSDTWQIESAAGRVLTNRPRQPETLHAIERFREVLPLTTLKQVKGLQKMMVNQKGSRLSVQPVTQREYEIVCRLGRQP